MGCLVYYWLVVKSIVPHQKVRRWVIYERHRDNLGVCIDEKVRWVVVWYFLEHSLDRYYLLLDCHIHRPVVSNHLVLKWVFPV